MQWLAVAAKDIYNFTGKVTHILLTLEQQQQHKKLFAVLMAG